MFLITFGAALLATLAGNFITFYVIGRMVERKEKKQMLEMVAQYEKQLEKIMKEQERMANYAKMEG
jgi:membrane protein DedA with SNARE-associated domain